MADRGNVYHDYYEIEKLRNRSKSDEDVINVQLYILGGKDAHILLTSRPDPPAEMPVYEVGEFNSSLLDNSHMWFQNTATF